MESLHLAFYSENSDFRFKLNNINDGSILFYIDIISIFSRIDKSKKEIHLQCLHQMNSILREKISIFVNTYFSTNKSVFKIKSFFDKIENNKWFLVSPENNLSTEQIVYVFELLKLKNQGISSNEDISDIINHRQKEFKDLFEKVLDNYTIHTLNPSKKIKIGQPNKNQRVCRFCGKTMADGATFNTEAHAIPEALGNKTIFSYEECDSCNQRLENDIEHDIIEYLNVYRVFWKIKGKSGIPKLKFKNNVEIKHDSNLNIQIQKNDIKDNNTSFVLPLYSYHNINYTDIYRALCKSVISVIDSALLPYFTNTIKWINKKYSQDNLPKVASLLNNNQFYKNPTLTYYVRKNDNTSIPYTISELKLWYFTFVYILPYCSRDNVDFSITINYDIFWNLFDHYNKVNGWYFSDFSSDQEKEPKYFLRFTPENEDNS